MATDASPLKVITNNVPPQLTPGKKVVALTAALEKKDAEKKALQGTIDELAGALAGLTVVKGNLDADGAGVAADASAATGKKDKNAPIPAKTAYKFFCDSHPKIEGSGIMRKLWKETSPEIRQSYEVMAQADKARYVRELEEKAALVMYYEKKKQERALEFYDAHLAAQFAREKADAEKMGKKKAKAKDPEAPKRPLSSYIYFAADKREFVTKKNPNVAPKEVMKILGEMWTQLNKGKTGKKGTKQYDDLAAEDKVRYVSEKKAYDTMLAERNKQAEQHMIERRNKDKEEALHLLKSRQEAATIADPAAVHATPMPSVAFDNMSVMSVHTTTQKTKKKKDPNAPKKALSAYIFFTTENRGQIQAQMKDSTSQPELLSEVGRQWRELSPEKKEKYVKLANEDKERYAKDMEKYTASKR